MKVAELNSMIMPLLPILEHYKEWTVEAMLQDIYQHCCQNSEVAAELKQATVSNRKDLPYRPSQEELLKILPEYSSAELYQIIDSYTIKQITDMAKDLDMKGHSKLNKDLLVKAFCRFLIEQRGARKDLEGQADLPGETKASILPPQEVRLENGAEEDISPELKAAADALPNLNAEERIKLLETFSKTQIEMIAHYHKLRIPKYNSKNNTIRILANQLGFLEVHRNMGKRR